MAVVEIINVIMKREDFVLLENGNIELPKTKEFFNAHILNISGWVLGKEQRALLVDITCEGVTIRKIPVNLSRPDVYAVFPGYSEAQNSGFFTMISTLGLPSEFQIDLIVVFQNGHKEKLGTIYGKRIFLETAQEPLFQPIILYALGRSGTTRIMQVLCEHPQIVVEKIFPYEYSHALHWIHAFKILTSPANHYSSTRPEYGDRDWNYVGHHPFFAEPIISNPEILKWFGYKYTYKCMVFFRTIINDYYKLVAKQLNKNRAGYFLEKWHAGFSNAWILHDIYPKARIIILVRDFRDTLVSNLSFSPVYFKNNSFNSEEEIIENFANEMRQSALKLISVMKGSKIKIVVCRYEDIIINPIESFKKLLGELELDCDSITVHEILNKTSFLNENQQKHITSYDIKNSIGRWKNDSTKHMFNLYDKYFKDILLSFGYEV